MAKKPRSIKSNNPKIRKKKYLDVDVLTMAKRRIRQIYSEFDHVVVSSSMGKDSIVAMELTIEVARELGRLPVEVNFFDEELLTHHTPDLANRTIKRTDEVQFNWWCLEIKHRNACSNSEPYWFPWDSQKSDVWVRELPKHGITSHPKFKPREDNIPKFLARKYPMSKGNICVITGVRSQESLRRYTVMMNKKHRNYISVSPEGGNVWTAHPIYDWQAKDIWKAIDLFGWDYNRYYDVLNKTKMHNRYLAQRLCAPLGEEPLRGLWQYAEIAPELYNAMLKRVPGVATAARYSNTAMYSVKMDTPPDGQTWQSFLYLIMENYEPKILTIVAQRINNLIQRHYKQSKLDLTEETADPVSGCSWKFLCKTAIRGDFKARTQGKMAATATKTLRKMNITLEEAIERYATEEYKREKLDRLRQFKGKKDDELERLENTPSSDNVDF